jgi:hypothetical protein
MNAVDDIVGTPDIIAPPYWDDRPVVIVGGGPSLRGFDFRRLRAVNATILGVNQSCFDAACHAGISIDRDFLLNSFGRLRVFMATRPFYLGRPPGSWKQRYPNCIHISALALAGIPDGIDRVHGCTSGHAALCLAALKLARKVILLGFDYRALEGAHHYHKGYPWFQPLANEQSWKVWAQHYDETKADLDARGVEVINGSEYSLITAFPRMTVERALAAL